MSVFDYLTSGVFWMTLATGIVGPTVATAMLVWLGKTWMTSRIQSSVNDIYKEKEQHRQADLNLQLETHKARLLQELEGWKLGYQKALDQNRVQFSRLHADRADAIRELYKRLVVVEHAVGVFVAPLRIEGSNGDRRHEEVFKAFNEFSVFFVHNRIFFTESDCDLIEKLRMVALEVFVVYDGARMESDPDGRRDRFKAYQTMAEKFEPLRKQLEGEFRATMGLVIESASR